MLTKNELFAQLRTMGAPQDGVVLMHSAFRTVGEVQGGAEGFLDALIEYFTANGGLFCVPTHTWHHLGTDAITLDLLHPESNLGVIPTLAAKRADGVRSENPCHSMVVFGERERALSFVRDDAFVKTPTSPESCYGKLYRENGHVLLVGVSQAKNTFLHTVDEMLGVPDRMDDTPIQTTVRREGGEILTRELTLFKCSTTEDISERFPKYEVAFRYHGAITDGRVGRAPAQLCSAVKMKEVVELILSRAGGKDPLGDEVPIPPKWFCTEGV
ncbi:MAG: AAC(3) family N-acetyltransferase [Clostridia bacterium]|nr:AAC(3) family N-acetyltransferase [Clostridia bacterium]